MQEEACMGRHFPTIILLVAGVSVREIVIYGKSVKNEKERGELTIILNSQDSAIYWE